MTLLEFEILDVIKRWPHRIAADEIAHMLNARMLGRNYRAQTIGNKLRPLRRRGLVDAEPVDCGAWHFYQLTPKAEAILDA